MQLVDREQIFLLLIPTLSGHNSRFRRKREKRNLRFIIIFLDFLRSTCSRTHGFLSAPRSHTHIMDGEEDNGTANVVGGANLTDWIKIDPALLNVRADEEEQEDPLNQESLDPVVRERGDSTTNTLPMVTSTPARRGYSSETLEFADALGLGKR